MRDRIVRWKYDLAIASGYLSFPMLFLTLATMLYPYVTVLFSIPFILYFVGMILLVVPLFKLIAKFIIYFGFYERERTYERKINPYDVDKLTQKEKIYYVPLTLRSCQLSLSTVQGLFLILDKLLENPEDYYSMRDKWHILKKQINRDLIELHKIMEINKQLLEKET